MPKNVIRTEKEAKLQDMLDHYEEISQIGVMDFYDYYDCRMDGIEEKDLQQSEELNAYVDQLLSFQKEAAAGKLEDEELDLFNALKNVLLAEPEENAVHKMLQFKTMDALLKTGGSLESDELKKAEECQALYNAIASNSIREENQRKRELKDDGSFNKSPRKIAEEILAKERQQEKQPLQQICNAMLKDYEKYTNLLLTPALIPYHMLLQEDILAKQHAENTMTPEQREKLQLTKEIAEKREQMEKLQKELDKTGELFDEVYDRAKTKFGVNLTVSSKKRKGGRRFLKASELREMQEKEKTALKDTFRKTTDDFARRVDAIKATDQGPTSDAFRQMMESLTMLKNQQKTMRDFGEFKNTRNKDFMHAFSKVYDDTQKYLIKRDQDGFFGRHFGTGGVRYKQAKEVMHLLEDFHAAVDKLEGHRMKDVLLVRQERKEALRREIASTSKDLEKLIDRENAIIEKEKAEKGGEKKQKSEDSRQRLKNGWKDIAPSSGKQHSTGAAQGKHKMHDSVQKNKDKVM